MLHWFTNLVYLVYSVVISVLIGGKFKAEIVPIKGRNAGQCERDVVGVYV